VGPRLYELSFKGSASPALQALFPDLEAVTTRGVTVLRGMFADQAALRGAMARITDLGLELLEVHLVTEDDDGGTDPRPASGTT